MTTYGRFIDENSGRRLDVTKDLERLERDLETFSPDDGRIIKGMVAGSRAMQGFDMGDMGMNKPQEFMGVWDKLKMMWKMRRIFRFYTGKYARPISDYVQSAHDPWLRLFIENLFSPEVPVWFVLSILAFVTDGQMALLKDGCMNFVLPIEKRFRQLGGQVIYRASVKEVLVESDRAVGVRLADGSVHHADIVISAADGYSTIFEMLNGRYVDEKIKNRYQHWKPVRPAAMISYGVAREFRKEPHLSLIVLKAPITVGSQVIPGFSLRIFNYGTKFAPPGKTVIQASFDTEWDYWNELQKDRPRYEAEKVRIASEVLKRLEAYYPGVSSQVEVTDVATPYTTWRYTMNHRGAYMGWIPTQEVIMSGVVRTLPGLANFYMAGQWTGAGGVPPSLYSGRQVIQLICHKDKKTFSSSFA